MKNIPIIGESSYSSTMLTSHSLKQGNKITVLDNFIYKHQFAITLYLGDPDYNFVCKDTFYLEITDATILP